MLRGCNCAAAGCLMHGVAAGGVRVLLLFAHAIGEWRSGELVGFTGGGDAVAGGVRFPFLLPFHLPSSPHLHLTAVRFRTLHIAHTPTHAIASLRNPMRPCRAVACSFARAAPLSVCLSVAWLAGAPEVVTLPGGP